MARDTRTEDEEYDLDDIDFMETAGGSMTSSRALWLIGGVALGAAAMYFLGSANGRRRLSVITERVKEYGEPLYQMANQAMHRGTSTESVTDTRH